MLPMLTWAVLSSNHIATQRLDGYVISALMATCTAGQPQCFTEQMALVIPSAAAEECASTTPWLPRRPHWQLSGTMLQMMGLLTLWWHRATSMMAGTIMPVAINSVPVLTPVSE